MPRAANPYYGADENLGAVLGQSLGRALFGDPEAARALAESKAKMAYMAAQAEESKAHAGLYGAQTSDQTARTGFRNQLGTLGEALYNIALGRSAAPAAAAPAQPGGLVPTGPAPTNSHDAAVAIGLDPALAGPRIPAPAPAAAPVDPYYAPAAAPAPAPAFDAEGFQRSIVPLIMALAGTQENPNIGDTVGALGAYLGNDEFARRSMIANHTTPGKEFALTPGRADEIAQNGYDADFKKDTRVATINHAQDVAVAQANHAHDIAVAQTNHASDIPVANIKAGADVDVANVKESGGYDRDGAIALGGTFGTVTSTVRTPKHNKEVGGVSNSYHLASRGGRAIDIQRRPGVTHAQIVQRYKQNGFTVLEDLDEGDHSHLALAGGPNVGKGSEGGKGKNKVKEISKADSSMLDEELTSQLEARGLAGRPDAGTLARIREGVYYRFQRGGNPASAVSETLDQLQKRAAAKDKKPPQQQQAKAAPKPKPQAKPAQGGGDERQKALAAISAGADPAKIRQLYKQRTGKNL